MPEISIILPSFNHEKYLREAIDSVLNQSFTDFELIIWDDASSDGSWAIIKSYSDPRIKVFRNETTKRGIYGINKAISEVTSGKYIAIHHSDDVWEPHKLKTQVDFLSAFPNIGAIFTNADAIGETSAPFADEKHFYCDIFAQPNRTRHQWLRFFFYHGNALCHPSVLIRKSCYRDIGLYRYGFAQQGDLDMWVRLCFKHEISVLPERLVKFRVRDGEANTSGNRPEVRSRLIWEFYQILNHYRTITDLAEFTMIFPETKDRFGNDLENGLIPFYLAMLALDKKEAPYQMFGMNALFDILQDGHIAEKLKKKHNFDYSNFIKLTARKKLQVKENFAKLYIDSGNGFNERESMLLPVNSNVTRLEFDLRAQEKITALRLDPSRNFAA
jgi:glycosyltransferase involved in cell wall biosynthesis